MKIILLVIFSLAAFLSCKHIAQKQTDIHIVPPRLKTFKKNLSGKPTPPPVTEYYFPSNFIIDTGGHVYYYQQNINSGWSCGASLDSTTPPPFLNLRPKDIIEIPDRSLEIFIKSNIQYLDNYNRKFSIAAVKDTIVSAGLTNIFSVLTDTNNHINWIFRKVTPEESIILKFKKSRDQYVSEKIDWDSIAATSPD